MDKERDIHLEILASMAERTIKRLWVIIILLVCIMAGMVAFYVWHESQFEYEITETYTSESDDGGIAIVNRDGAVNYGESILHADEETDQEDRR